MQCKAWAAEARPRLDFWAFHGCNFAQEQLVLKQGPVESYEKYVPRRPSCYIDQHHPGADSGADGVQTLHLPRPRMLLLQHK